MLGCAVPAGSGRGDRDSGATNIRLRWSREEKGKVWALQTFGSAGAGRRKEGLGATNIRLRWSRNLPSKMAETRT
jgi:hypothetical protein